MTNEQLTLLDHLTAELDRVSQTIGKKPLPMKTAAISERLGISTSTLHRAKKERALPIKVPFGEKNVVIDFAYQEKRKDYWIAYEED
jgi:predicted DNA-binding transcriptional regulator AlpA